MKNRPTRATKLKKLQSEIAGLEAEKKELNKESILFNNKITKIDKQINNLKENIERLLNKDIIVSEHSFLRYFERVLDYNLEEIKDQILTQEIKDQHSELESGSYPNEINGKKFKLLIRNNVVVTIED